LELKQLRYFLAIAEQEHFGRAAQRLRVAQPALTRQMHKLEQELQVRLFDRLPRGIRVSAAGRALQEDARRVLADIDQVARHVQLVGRGKMGVLRLGYIEVAGWHGIVPDSIREFTASAHEVRVEPAAMASLDQLAAIRERQLDAGFLYNAPQDDPDMVVQRLEEHAVCLAVPRGSHLADRKRIRLADLTGEPLILFQRSGSPAFHDALLTELARRDVEPRVVHEAANEAAMLTLVTTGAGAAIVNSCHRWRLPQGVQLLAIDDLPVTLELCLVYLRENRSPPLLRFKDWFESAAHGRGQVSGASCSGLT
jgi:DNA-binding transcriptional LysR family regulator